MQHRTDRRTLPFTLKHSARWVATALCLALPVGAQALGVGQLQVRSALNQPLNAEVELLEVKPGDLDSLRVRIATQSLGGFEPSADMIDYRIESREGRHFLQLTSSRAIREPLLNFLIELHWERGRLLREVAVFLDPPDPLRMPTLAEAPPAPPAPRAPAAPRQAAAPAPTTPAATGEGLSYGPVRRGETLWNIAQRTRPGPEVSMQQMMQAIYQANPQAFARANMDTLMAGATLRIPPVDGRAPRPASPPAEPVPQVAVTPPRPQPEPPAPPPPAPEPIAEAVPEPPRPADEVQVRLVPPPESVVPPTAAPVAPRLRSEGQPFRLQVAGLDSLRERVRTLQDDQPELLIARSEPEETVTTAPSPAEPTEPAPVAEPESPVPAEAPSVADDSAVPELDDAVTIEEPAVTIPTPADAALSETTETVSEAGVATTEELAVPEVGIESALTEPALEPAATETPIADPAVAEPEVLALAPTEPTPAPDLSMPVVPAEPAPRPEVLLADPPSPPAMSSGVDITGLLLQFQRDPMGTLSDLRREPIALPLLGGGLALLLLLGWLIRRAKRSGEEQAGVYDTPSPVAASGPAVPPRPASAARDTTDGGASQEKARRLGRVDFLIAGGSYREAENLVRLIMVEEPDNPELQAKLLDIYYKSGDSDKFIETAEALKRQLGEDSAHPLWQKTRRMGNEISPGHPLFIDADDDEDTVVFGPQRQVDRPVRGPDPEAAVAQPRAPRLAFPGEAMPQTSEASRSELRQAENDTTQIVPDFTLSDLDRPSTKAVMADQQAAERRTAADTGDESALPDPAEWRSRSDAQTPPQEENPFATLFTTEPPQPPGAEPDNARQKRTMSESGYNELPRSGMEEEVLFNEDEEAVEIKLDLAQAYLDMDDRIGARTLLDEVLREGNEAQQARAKSILKSMS